MWLGLEYVDARWSRLLGQNSVNASQKRFGFGKRIEIKIEPLWKTSFATHEPLSASAPRL